MGLRSGRPVRRRRSALGSWIMTPGSGRLMRSVLAAAAQLACVATPTLAFADPDPAPAAPQTWAIHGQATFIDQGNAGFRAPYEGRNSLASDANGRETA